MHATPQARIRAHIVITTWEFADMRKSITIVALLGMVALTACNTVRGVGRDVQSAGRTVEKTTH